ncbi:kinase binding protein CGI-121-domain-containing protein [Cokeromyces recurvatus]|uniref:kinase binding protein CGI-121-domain-containing protein n=1 Tax=Cokeromyces recurvatus TaxID=90255 RepID=UPI00221E8561|nr:kinase binding protein CGI-121-domain-containing protein [Cokeromyces recurvatus]KAI7902360.1 kinase binding protein CGI-121-domain-containing protein [Cokeromyces recurvatus]
MESYTLELHPSTQVYIALFENVKNASALKQRFIDQDATLTCSLINAKLVIDKSHILLATNRAVSDEANGTRKTQSIHSEILFNFGIINNIGKIFRTFGITDDTTNIIAVKVGGSEAEAESFMKENIQGDLVPLDNLKNITDFKEIEKVYQTGDQGQDKEKLLSLVAGGIALRGHT